MPTQPRVLHIIDTGGPGGAETVLLAIAREGQLNSYNAAVAIPYDGWLATSLRTAGLEPSFLPLKTHGGWRLLRSFVDLARLTDANLLHTHLLGAGVYGAACAALLKLPAICVFHGETDLQKGGAFEWLKRVLLLRSHVQIVAVSDAVADALAAWRIPRHRIAVIPNGVDSMSYSPGRGGALQSELKLPPETPIVGAVGNIRPSKDYSVLIQAAGAVLRSLPDVHFVITGQGTDSDVVALRKLSETLGIGQKVHFLGFRQSNADLYRSMRVFASSAYSEGLPLTFLEAMACGTPIAATANDGSSRLLTGTGAGFLSPVRDAEALASSITRLLQDRKLAEAAGARGRTIACRDFSLRRTLDAYSELYRRLLNGYGS